MVEIRAEMEVFGTRENSLRPEDGTFGPNFNVWQCLARYTGLIRSETPDIRGKTRQLTLPTLYDICRRFKKGPKVPWLGLRLQRRNSQPQA